MKTLKLTKIMVVILCASCAARWAHAGPPFVTDDPEPVPYQHWEIYLASQTAHDAAGWAGTAPHVEVNYGVVSNLQLHIITPLAYAAPAHENSHLGLGDVELGAKYRFVEETDWLPQIGVFPLVDVPTGNADLGLGAGYYQLFLPLWLQKSVGKWTTYGGGGYWINPGADNRNWWFMGWLLQYQLRPDLAIGAEIFHETAQQVAGTPATVPIAGTFGTATTALNFGAIFDFNENHHLMFSSGPVIQGPSGFQAYLAYQITFGPHTAGDAGK